MTDLDDHQPRTSAESALLTGGTERFDPATQPPDLYAISVLTPKHLLRYGYNVQVRRDTMSLKALQTELETKADKTHAVTVVETELIDGKLLVEHRRTDGLAGIVTAYDVERIAVLDGDDAQEAGAADGHVITAFVEA